jgi:hypothetical protein
MAQPPVQASQAPSEPKKEEQQAWGYPNSWMVYFMENPMRNQMKPMKILNMI